MPIWWVVPLVLLVAGWISAQVYFRRNYEPDCYCGDFITLFVSMGIFGLFALFAVGICIGRCLA